MELHALSEGFTLYFSPAGDFLQKQYDCLPR